MKKIEPSKIYETDLYKPIQEYFIKEGYEVYGEVKNCDVTAVRGEEIVIIELKRSFNLGLLMQGVQRQKISEIVYVAVPRPSFSMYSKKWKDICHIVRRLELGLIIVLLAGDKSEVEVVFNPSTFDRVKSRNKTKNKRIGIMKEIEGRSGDFNVGGSTRKKIITAYKENSIHIACCFEKFGPLSPKRLREIGTGDKTLSILSKNYYGWFEKCSRGIYTISDKGREELWKNNDVAKNYQIIIKNQVEKI